MIILRMKSYFLAIQNGLFCLQTNVFSCQILVFQGSQILSKFFQITWFELFKPSCSSWNEKKMVGRPKTASIGIAKKDTSNRVMIKSLNI